MVVTKTDEETDLMFIDTYFAGRACTVMGDGNDSCISGTAPPFYSPTDLPHTAGRCGSSV